MPGPRTVPRSPRPYEGALDRFADDLFGHLPRADQRHWAHTYLRGLLLSPDRKSPRRMAAALREPPNTADSLRQFVHQSPWDWAPARTRLALRALAHGASAHHLPAHHPPALHLPGRQPPLAWVADLAVIPKSGRASPGVHRRHLPHLGRTVNCQVAMGLFLACGPTALPVEWSLFVDREWAADEQRRARARMPDVVGHRTPEDQIPELAEWAAAHLPAPTPPLVASLKGAPHAAALIARMNRHGVRFVVEVRPGQPVLLDPPHPGQGAREGSSAPWGGAIDAHDALRLAGRRQVRQFRPSEAHREPLPVATLTADVRLPGPPESATGPAPGTYRLLARQSTAPRPPRYWVTNLTDARPEDVLALARLRPRARESIRVLGEDFGLLDFEGRSFPGWHHHMTLVSAAYGFHRMEARGRPPGSDRRPPV
ncbi:transposase [Streptomyces sp. NPDC050848]|uniref:IS701 family transposase n=1 Tax=Streptomyces sp. NPDC050848 TaxID=3155791 RepID=UPI0033CFBFAD